ncbi:MAG: TIGR02757 family protein [Bacteroidaceae bacterium]|nr:TIGR02757 family protein [Bacteroidaceae bacterium]
MTDTSLNATLAAYAERYERPEFIIGDPSWFMHQVRGDANREAMAFVAAALSYGSRAQFMPKVQTLLDASGGDIDAWVRSGAFEDPARSGDSALLPNDARCFYRLQTRAAMHAFLRALRDILRRHGSLHSFVAAELRHATLAPPRQRPESRDALAAITALARHFAAAGSTGVIPKDATSACKRVCMFLRWMVRTDSPVDLGLWADTIDRRALIMPMDTHVVQQARRLGLLRTATTSMATALELTRAVAATFPDDPLRADFALFGYGVDHPRR